MNFLLQESLTDICDSLVIDIFLCSPKVCGQSLDAKLKNGTNKKVLFCASVTT